MTVNRTTLLDLPLPVTGTESGTWGDTTNNGLTQYMDIAIAGMSNLTSANFTAGALTIETTEGDSSATNISATSAQYAGFRVTSLAANSTITVGNTGTSPARSYRLINADATYSLTFKATGQTGVTLLPGQSAVVAFNGTDYVIVGVVGAGTATDNAVARFDGTTGEIIQNSGVTIDDSNNVSGVAQLNITTLDATNIEVTNIKAKDGTAAGSIADSTGVVTLGSSVLTTTDINGGTIDGTAIGASSASTGAFTTLSASSTVTLSGGTANGVLYLNGSKVATSGSALTFDGTNLGVTGNTNGLVTTNVTNSNAGTSARADSIVTSDSADIRMVATSAAYTGVSGWADTGIISTSSSTSGGMLFNVQLGSPVYRFMYLATNELMRLDSTGLGIGTSSPSAKLTVNDANNVPIRIGDISAAPVSQTAVYVGASTGALSGAGNGDLVLIPRTSDARSILFYTGNGTAAERMRLDSSGNLGLGVTPSAWDSTYKAFQSTTSALASASGDVKLLQNAYYDGGWKYMATQAASMYSQASGAHNWRIAPSGTAGNAITFTQAMTLDASGRWMLGTTSPFNAIGASIQSQSGTWAAGIHLRGPSVSNGCYFAASTSSTTTDFEIWNEQNGYLRFATNNTERARITSGGYFKASDSGAYIGSTGAYHELVSSTGSATAAVYIRNTNATSPAGIDLSYSAASPNGTGNIFLYCQDSTALRMSVRSNGGIANYQSNNVDLSDARTKKDINPAASMWNKIGALEIVTYKYNDQTHDDVNVGVIAQQVERVEPVWVDADGFGDTPEDGVPLKTVYTKDITFAAIKALQEAMARIETLEAKVSALEGTQP